MLFYIVMSYEFYIVDKELKWLAAAVMVDDDEFKEV